MRPLFWMFIILFFSLKVVCGSTLGQTLVLIYLYFSRLYSLPILTLFLVPTIAITTTLVMYENIASSAYDTLVSFRSCLMIFRYLDVNAVIYFLFLYYMRIHHIFSVFLKKLNKSI